MSMRRWCLVAILSLCPLAALAETAPWYQSDFPPEEFRSRWDKVFERIGDKSVAVVAGASQTNGFIFPRQTNDFYYLCGVETPGSYVLLDGRNRKVTLYLPPRNKRLEAAEGKVLSADDADLVKRLTAADDVQSTDAMRGDWLASLPGGTPTYVWTPYAPAEGAAQSRYELQAANAAIAADPWDGRIPREARFVELLRTRYWRAAVKDLTPVLDELRIVKSSREIALMKRASRLAGLGLIEAMKSTRPGVFEFQLDAVARYVFRQRREARSLPVDHRLGDRQHRQHALLSQQRGAQIRRLVTDGLCPRLSRLCQ